MSARRRGNRDLSGRQYQHLHADPKGGTTDGNIRGFGVKTGIILVGGEARRAGGREKYFFEYQGQTFIARLVSTLRESVDEIIIVAKDIEQCERFSAIPDIVCISDIRSGIGPIGGLHAGALAARGDLLLVVACDMPCISHAVIGLLFSLIGDHDAVIPCWNGGMFEPLHAVYRREAVIEYLREHTSLSMRDMVRSLNTRIICVEQIRKIDPQLQTFTNINHPEELEQFNNNGHHDAGA